MLAAVVVLDFDPTLEIGGYFVRWETLALAATILLGLLLAAWLAGRANRSGAQPALRRDDQLYVVIAALPGAVAGGRILHGLDFYEFYAADWGALLEVGRGSLSLLGAVLGGCLTAAYVGWLIGAPLRRWLDVAIVPLLLVIGLGKFANVLGGTGQGGPTELPWALAFGGGGPWRSLGADVPSHPSQVYEGAWALAGILVVGLFLVPLVWRTMPARLRAPAVAAGGNPLVAGSAGDAIEPGGRAALGGLRPGFLFGLGLAWWALGRVVVGFSWRDQPIVAGLNMEQLAALAVVAGCLAILARPAGRVGRSSPLRIAI